MALKSFRVASVLFSLLFGASTMGCSTPSPEDLEVKLYVTHPQALLKSGSTLVGGNVEGSFTLEMALNPNAAESTTVHVDKFVLASTSGESFIDPISLPTGSKVDQTLASGDAASIDYAFQNPNVSSALVDKLCAATLVFVATVNDSAQGRTKTVKSDSFTLGGCP